MLRDTPQAAPRWRRSPPISACGVAGQHPNVHLHLKTFPACRPPAVHTPLPPLCAKVRTIQARYESATQLIEEAALWSSGAATPTVTAASEAVWGKPSDVPPANESGDSSAAATAATPAPEETETSVSSGVERRARARSSGGGGRHAVAAYAKPTFNAAAAAAAIAAAAARGDAAGLAADQGVGGVDFELARMARYGARRQLEEVVARWRSVEPMLMTAATEVRVVEVRTSSYASSRAALGGLASRECCDTSCDTTR